MGAGDMKREKRRGRRDAPDRAWQRKSPNAIYTPRPSLVLLYPLILLNLNLSQRTGRPASSKAKTGCTCAPEPSRPGKRQAR